MFQKKFERILYFVLKYSALVASTILNTFGLNKLQGQRHLLSDNTTHMLLITILVVITLVMLLDVVNIIRWIVKVYVPRIRKSRQDKLINTINLCLNQRAIRSVVKSEGDNNVQRQA